MQVWRRWNAVPPLMVLALLAQSGFSATPPTWTADASTINSYIQAEATDMAAATPADAVRLRTEIEAVLMPPKASGTAPAKFKTAFADAVDTSFGPLVKSDKSHVALNSIILISDIQHINLDGTLDRAVSNSSPAVRYWASHGLTLILPDLKAVPRLPNRAAQVVVDALATENSPLVKGEMTRVLAAALPLKPISDPGPNDPKVTDADIVKALINVLTSSTKSFSTGADNTTTAATITVLNAVAAAPTGSFKSPDDMAAIQEIVNILGLSAQSLLVEIDDPRVDAKKASVVDLATAGVAAINKITGKRDVSFSGGVRANSAVPDIAGAITDITGLSDKGKIQTLYPKLKLPPKLTAAGK